MTIKRNTNLTADRTQLILTSFVINEYVSYTQKWAYTWDSILATIGGAVQFWIGAGVVSVCHW